MSVIIIKTLILSSPPWQGGVAEGRGGFRLPQICNLNILKIGFVKASLI